MQDPHPKPVENYTTASLIMIFVNMLWIFAVIWVNFGLLTVMLVGWCLNQLIKLLQAYKASREIRWPSDA